MEEPKYCLSAKHLLQCGTGIGIFEDENGFLVLKDKRGIYISDTYDSGKKDMIWNQLSLTIKKVNFTVYVVLFHDQSEETLFTKDSEIENQFEEIKKKSSIVSNYCDILLFDKEEVHKGRYLKFAIEFINKKDKNMICLEKYALSFPKHVFTEYLPNIYQGNVFLERFISIFQNIYLETEQKIDSFPSILDYETADIVNLHLLATWLGLSYEEYGIDYEAGFIKGYYTEDALRNLVKNGIWLNKHKGTREYYEKLIQWITGEKPIIVSYKDTNRYEKNSFKILLIKEYNKEIMDYLTKVLNHTKPFNAKFQIICLDKKYALDEDSYLGINSFLL